MAKAPVSTGTPVSGDKRWAFIIGLVLPMIRTLKGQLNRLPNAEEVAEALKDNALLSIVDKATGQTKTDTFGNPITHRQKLGSVFNALKQKTRAENKKTANPEAYRVVTEIASKLGFKRGRGAAEIGEVDANALLSEILD